MKLKETKAKKCDLCDEFASVKFQNEEHSDLYDYLCQSCFNEKKGMKKMF